MDEMPRDEDVGCSARARAEWVHALRNAANTAGVTLAMGRRLLEHGDTAGALDMLGRCDAAWADSRDLLRDASRATTLYPEAPPMSREDAQSPASRSTHR